MNKAPKVVYHYCSQEAFESIIKHKCLWISLISICNDSKELDHASDLLFEHLKHYQLDKYINLLNALDDCGKRELYFCSFSTKRDDLSQWWGYANDGTGYAIGFNTNIFPKERYTPWQKIGKENTSLFFDKVIYDNSKKKSIIKKLLPMKKDLKSPDFTPYDFMSNKIKISPLFKTHSFHNEDEWRLLYDPGKEYSRNHIMPKGVSDLSYRHTKYGLTSYFKYNFDIKDSPLKEVIIGPKNNSKEDIVHDFILHCGYDLNWKKVKKSSSSYI